MDYQKFRTLAQTGGVLGVHGKGPIGFFIKLFTAESLQHVAIIFWHEGGLFVAEFTEGVGFRIMPASQWFKLKKKYKIVYGKPPLLVANKEKVVKTLIFNVRDNENWYKKNYNYWELPLVWFANIFNTTTPIAGVCSSFVGKIYDACGVEAKMQVPGDFFKICPDYFSVTYEPQ